VARKIEYTGKLILKMWKRGMFAVPAVVVEYAIIMDVLNLNSMII